MQPFLCYSIALQQCIDQWIVNLLLEDCIYWPFWNIGSVDQGSSGIETEDKESNQKHSHYRRSRFLLYWWCKVHHSSYFCSPQRQCSNIVSMNRSSGSWWLHIQIAGHVWSQYKAIHISCWTACRLGNHCSIHIGSPHSSWISEFLLWSGWSQW